jgi:hypothetical protein
VGKIPLHPSTPIERATRPPAGETATTTTTTHQDTKASRATRAANLAAGFKKRYSNGSEKITLPDGQTKTIDEVTTGLQAVVTNRANVTAARAALKAEVEAEGAQLPALVELMRAAVAFVRFNFGSDPEALADFGLQPHKARTPPTAEQKAIAVAKREATREARGTKSAKAKKDIHGNIAAKLVVTPADPSTPMAPLAPTAGPTQPKS